MSNNQRVKPNDASQLEAIELNDWLVKIECFHPKEIELGLSRIKDIAGSLGLLKPNAKVVIVGGTNGKGSCVATLESLALQSKLKVGCYTSPHLMMFNERIRINGANVSDKALNEAFRQIEKWRGEVPLTFFEFTTLAALQIFSTQKLDLIVLEVGLGGRLDAVNIINPNVAIITTIAKDHTDWLGDTLEEISVEKSGIFRATSLNLVGDVKTFELLKKSISDLELSFRLTIDNELNAIPLLEHLSDTQVNPYQLKRQNIVLALTCFTYLFRNLSQHIDLKNILKNICLTGRFQKIQNMPQVIIDVAHNPQAASNLLNQIESLSCNGCRIAICGLMSDKAVKEYLQILDKSIDVWLFVDLPSKRATLATDLKRFLTFDQNDRSNITSKHKTFSHMSLACEYANEIMSSDDHLYIMGSFITVSEFLKLEKEFQINDSAL